MDGGGEGDAGASGDPRRAALAGAALGEGDRPHPRQEPYPVSPTEAQAMCPKMVVALALVMSVAYPRCGTAAEDMPVSLQNIFYPNVEFATSEKQDVHVPNSR